MIGPYMPAVDPSGQGIWLGRTGGIAFVPAGGEPPDGYRRLYVREEPATEERPADDPRPHPACSLDAQGRRQETRHFGIPEGACLCLGPCCESPEGGCICPDCNGRCGGHAAVTP